MTADEFATLRHNVADCGFAALAGQPIDGVNSLAIPILEPDGSLVGAILMIGNEAEMDVACGAALNDEVRALQAPHNSEGAA